MAEVQIIEKVNGRIDRNKGTIINGPIKVAAYARVSTDKEDQKNSYESQLKYYMEKMNANPKWIATQVYADEAISGTQDYKRSDFMRMIHDALNGKFDLLLTKSISRFARNTVDTLSYVRKLKEKNVAILFEEENINTLEMSGELLLTILSSVAQQESETISSHVKLGLKMKMQRGELVGFHGCYGYDYDKLTKTLTVNEEEKKVIQYIFGRFAQGAGTTMIAKELTEARIPTRRGNPIWCETVIRKIIKNEKYKGDLLQGKTFTVDPITHRRLENMGEEQKYLIEKNHEAIIDDETWDKVQEILQKRSESYNKGTRNGTFRRMYAFSGITYCAFCGRLVTRKNWVSSTKNKKAWYCSTAIKQGKKYCRDSKPIPEKVIEKCFLDAYRVLCVDKANIIRNFMEKAEPILQENNSKEEIEKLNIQEHDLKERLKKLLDLKLDNTITEEAFKEKNHEIERKIRNIQKQIEHKASTVNKEYNLKSKMEEIKNLLKSHDIITEFDREVFDILVDKVIIGETDEEGNKNPYVISFILKNSKKSDSDELSEDSKKKVKKKSIKTISIEDKNVICEIKSFQKLKIFEKDEDLFRTKKQLEYIKVKVAVNDDEEIKFNETINQKVTQEIERDISSYMAN